MLLQLVMTQGIVVGKYHEVSDLLIDIFNKNIPQAKFDFMRSLERVIDFFSNLISCLKQISL